jgi:predicted nucleic acid-binding Zn ribbon protein
MKKGSTTPREYCIVCEGKIHRTKSATRHGKTRRPPKGITCSSRCSKVYSRIYHYLVWKRRK